MDDVTMEYFPAERMAIFRDPLRPRVHIHDVTEEEAVRTVISWGYKLPTERAGPAYGRSPVEGSVMTRATGQILSVRK